MTFYSARSNSMNLAAIKKIESSFVPIGLLTKIEIFQSDRIISWDLSSYKKKLIWTTKYAQTCNWFFFWCVKKLSRVVFPYDFWHKKNYSVTSFKTLRRVFKQLLSDFWWLPSALDRFEATFFWPTNKDSNQIKPSKPIGFVIWVKKLQDKKHIRFRYLQPNFEQLLFWALV